MKEILTKLDPFLWSILGQLNWIKIAIFWIYDAV